MSFKNYLKEHLEHSDELYSYVNEMWGLDDTGKYYELPTLINNISNTEERTKAISEVLECIRDFLSKYKNNSQKFAINLIGKNQYLFELLNLAAYFKRTQANMRIDAYNYTKGRYTASTGNDLRDLLIDNYLNSLNENDFFCDSGNSDNQSWAYEFVIKGFMKRFNISVSDLNPHIISKFKIPPNKEFDIDVYIKFNFVEYVDSGEGVFMRPVKRASKRKIFFYFDQKILNELSFHISKR